MTKLFLIILFSGSLLAQVPTISSIVVTTDTNTAMVGYTVSSPSYTVTAASWSSSTNLLTYTIGSNTLGAGAEVQSVAGFSNTACNSGFTALSVTTGTTVSIPMGSSPGTCSGTGTLTIIPYCSVQYDMVSGGTGAQGYLWQSRSFAATFTPGICNMIINGLQDGATYYFLPTARPDPDDNANICNSSGCGAIEQTATLPPASANHLPVPPGAVQANLMCEPDNSLCSSYPDYDNPYVTVPLAACVGGVISGTETSCTVSQNGECVSTAVVNPPAGYTIGDSWGTGTSPTQAIAVGDSLSTILTLSNGKEWYGEVFEIPQGVFCAVPVGAGLTGYPPRDLPVDPLAALGLVNAPNHRWIIWRTAPGGVADFAPFGTRTDPSVYGASHLGGFEAVTAQREGAGIIFDYGSAGSVPGLHHWWMENMEWKVDETQQTASWGSFSRWASGDGGSVGPFPSYLVFRGLYLHGPQRTELSNNLPFVYGGITGTWGPNVAIVGNYFDNFWPSGTDLGYAIYMVSCVYPATCAGLGGPYLIANNYLEGLDMNIYAEEDNGNASNIFHDLTITHNALHWPYPAAFTYAQASGSGGCRNQFELKSGIQVLFKGNWLYGAYACEDRGPAILLEINSVGTDIAITSNVITKAASILVAGGDLGGGSLNQSGMNGSGRINFNNNLAFDLGGGNYSAGGGGSYTSVIIGGNVNNFGFKHNTIVGPFTNNIPDVGIYQPWIVYSNTGNQGEGDNFSFTNNLIPFGAPGGITTSGIYTEGPLTGYGMQSHPMAPTSVNSGGWTPINFSYWLGGTFGHTALTSGLGMGGATVSSGGTGYPPSGNVIFTGCSTAPVATFKSTESAVETRTIASSIGAQHGTASYFLNSNVLYNYASWMTYISSGSPAPGQYSITVVPNTSITYNFNATDVASGATIVIYYTYSASGAINSVNFTSYGTSCNPATMTVAASTSGGGSGAVLYPAYGRTPGFIWQNNVVTGEDYEGADLTPAQIQSTCSGGSSSSFAYTMPAGDLYPCQTTSALRHVAAGLINGAASDYRVFSTPPDSGNNFPGASGSSGANVNQIAIDQGWVTNVSVAVTSTSVAISYTAPDANPVTLDVYCGSWSRQTDSGGYPLRRTQTVTGLSASTSCQYRVIGYFDQSAAISTAGVADCTGCGGWLLPIGPFNLNTDGTFTTLASGAGTRNPSFTVNLSSFSGATASTITLTAVGGTQYTNTCGAGACVVSGVPLGDYSVVRSYSGGGKTWSSDAQQFSVR